MLQAPVGFYLDSREVEVFKALDPKVQDRWHIQSKLKSALLGYATMDLLESKKDLVFGTWNPRLLRSQQVKRLVDSFHTEGLERFDLKTVIPIVISKRLVHLPSLAEHPESKLPTFSLASTAPEGTKIKCAGGRHRVEALVQYMEDINKNIEQIHDERKKLASIPDEELDSAQIARYNKTFQDDIKRLGGIQKYKGEWMIVVYDEGTQIIIVSRCF